MGSIAVTTGTVRVRDCREVKSILKALDELAKGMDERRVEIRKANRRKYGSGVLEDRPHRTIPCIRGLTSRPTSRTLPASLALPPPP